MSSKICVIFLSAEQGLPIIGGNDASDSQVADCIHEIHCKRVPGIAEELCSHSMKRRVYALSNPRFGI